MTKSPRTLFTLLAIVWSACSQAQDASTTIFNFLRLPASSHSMALGGIQVAAPDDDAALLLQNPALMANITDRSINLGFLSYMQGCKSANASYAMAAGERGTWGVGAQLLGYGSMKEMNVDGIELGDYAALDMALSGGYSYTLTDHWAGGALGKFVYSKYGHFTSVALAVDLGLNYLNDAGDFSFSLVAANLGGQVKPFGDKREHLPLDIRTGITKQLANAPIRFSVSMVDLTHWSSRHYYNPTREKEKAGRILMNHFVLGVDILPTEQLYVAAGFNFRRASELKAAGSSHAAGLSFGAGVNLKRFKVGVSYAKFHVSMPALMANVQCQL
ncbi:MAG: type IX secretion system protein PorQ [Bacteroidaceae bacterium]|nr:type IX secretion system protein PorQ [Bacteroidaceae bacterium]